MSLVQRLATLNQRGYGSPPPSEESTMNNIVYIVGAVVIVIAVLTFVGVM